MFGDYIRFSISLRTKEPNSTAGTLSCLSTVNSQPTLFSSLLLLPNCILHLVRNYTDIRANQTNGLLSASFHSELEWLTLLLPLPLRVAPQPAVEDSALAETAAETEAVVADADGEGVAAARVRRRNGSR
jgi:hypothetical protein